MKKKFYRIQNSYLGILFPFIQTIQFSLFGIPLIAYFYYISKNNIQLLLSLIFLVFWGSFLILNGFNRGVRKYPNVKWFLSMGLILVDSFLGVIYLYSLIIVYKFITDTGVNFSNIILILYLLIPIFIKFISKFKF